MSDSVDPPANPAGDASPARVELGEDDGFVAFAYGAVTQANLYRAHNRLIAIRARHADAAAEGEAAGATDAENQAVAEYMTTLGFGGVSHRMALRFVAAVHANVDGPPKKRGWGGVTFDDARMSRFFGFPVFDLPPSRKLVL
jgi:hypothetical protein